MSALTFILVVLVAFIAGVASVVDERQFHRPLVACTLMGFALGDPTTGIMLGGALELIALGWMNVGAAMAPDAALASTVSTVVAVVFVNQGIAQGNAINQAVTVAVLVAAAGQGLTIFVRTIAIFFAHQADRFAEQANYRGIAIMHFTALGLQGLRVAVPTAAVAILADGETVKDTLEAIPKVITDGLNIAGGFIVVVGYAMVINMMKARKLMPFFFLGFVFATFGTTVTSHSGKVEDQLDKGVNGMADWIVSSTPTAVSLVALGILGACLAVIYVQLNPEFHDSVRLPAAASPAAGGGSNSDLDDDLDDELD